MPPALPAVVLLPVLAPLAGLLLLSSTFCDLPSLFFAGRGGYARLGPGTRNIPGAAFFFSQTQGDQRGTTTTKKTSRCFHIHGRACVHSAYVRTYDIRLQLSLSGLLVISSAG